MLYTVIEVSKKLSISRQAIYKKIEKMTELKPHIKIKNNVKYIDEEGLELIRVSMDDNLVNIENTGKDNINDYNFSNEETFEKLTSSQDLFIGSYIKNLEEDKRKLFEEIQIKNKQIEALTDALSQSQKLNENNQVLLQQSQQKVFFLEQTNHDKLPWWKRIFSQGL
jgi:predicted DNA-binding transcriptional regulator AlpA